MVRMDIWDMVDKILDRLNKLEQLTDNLAAEMIRRKREDIKVATAKQKEEKDGKQ